MSMADSPNKISHVVDPRANGSNLCANPTHGDGTNSSFSFSSVKSDNVLQVDVTAPPNPRATKEGTKKHTATTAATELDEENDGWWSKKVTSQQERLEMLCERAIKLNAARRRGKVDFFPFEGHGERQCVELALCLLHGWTRDDAIDYLTKKLKKQRPTKTSVSDHIANLKKWDYLTVPLAQAINNKKPWIQEIQERMKKMDQRLGVEEPRSFSSTGQPILKPKNGSTAPQSSTTKRGKSISFHVKKRVRSRPRRTKKSNDRKGKRRKTQKKDTEEWSSSSGDGGDDGGGLNLLRRSKGGGKKKKKTKASTVTFSTTSSNSLPVSSSSPSEFPDTFSHHDDLSQPHKGHYVFTLWGDDGWYRGKVVEFSPATESHLILYDDKKQVWHKLVDDRKFEQLCMSNKQVPTIARDGVYFAAADDRLMLWPTAGNLPTTASINEKFGVAPNTEDKEDKRLVKLTNGTEIYIPEEFCLSDDSSNHEVTAAAANASKMSKETKAVACITPVSTNGGASHPRHAPRLNKKRKKPKKKRKKEGVKKGATTDKISYDESDHEEHRNIFSLTVGSPNQTTFVVSSPNPTTFHFGLGLGVPEPIAVDAQQTQQTQQTQQVVQPGYVTPLRLQPQTHGQQNMSIQLSLVLHRSNSSALKALQNSSPDDESHRPKKRRKILGTDPGRVPEVLFTFLDQCNNSVSISVSSSADANLGVVNSVQLQNSSPDEEPQKKVGRLTSPPVTVATDDERATPSDRHNSSSNNIDSDISSGSGSGNDIAGEQKMFLVQDRKYHSIPGNFNADANDNPKVRKDGKNDFYDKKKADNYAGNSAGNYMYADDADDADHGDHGDHGDHSSPDDSSDHAMDNDSFVHDDTLHQSKDTIPNDAGQVEPFFENFEPTFAKQTPTPTSN